MLCTCNTSGVSADVSAIVTESASTGLETELECQHGASGWAVGF
jgi:hypothetical protein